MIYITYHCPGCGNKIPDTAQGPSMDECPQCQNGFLRYDELQLEDGEVIDL